MDEVYVIIGGGLAAAGAELTFSCLASYCTCFGRPAAFWTSCRFELRDGPFGYVEDEQGGIVLVRTSCRTGRHIERQAVILAHQRKGQAGKCETVVVRRSRIHHFRYIVLVSVCASKDRLLLFFLSTCAEPVTYLPRIELMESTGGEISRDESNSEASALVPLRPAEHAPNPKLPPLLTGPLAPRMALLLLSCLVFGLAACALCARRPAPAARRLAPQQQAGVIPAAAAPSAPAVAVKESEVEETLAEWRFVSSVRQSQAYSLQASVGERGSSLEETLDRFTALVTDGDGAQRHRGADDPGSVWLLGDYERVTVIDRRRVNAPTQPN